MQYPSNSRSISAGIIATVGVVLFTSLLLAGRINQWGYLFLIALVALVSVVVHGFGRLRELDLKNLRMTLDRMEQVRADVYAKEDDLRKASVVLTRLAIFITTYMNRCGNEHSAQFIPSWVCEQSEELLKALGVSEDDRAAAFDIPNAYEPEANEKSH